VLESAAVCPGCRHHLRFNTTGKQADVVDGYRALSVDGTIAHKQTREPCEYCIVLDITNERGERLVRQVVGVGALQPGEQRRLNLSVDMLPMGLPVPKAQTAAPAPSPPAAGRAAPPSGQPAAADRARVASPIPAVNPARTPSATPPRNFTPQSQSQPQPRVTATAAAPAATPPAPSTASKALNPGPGGTLGQRLRIFRKP
jgi:hypothetical protein